MCLEARCAICRKNIYVCSEVVPCNWIKRVLYEFNISINEYASL